MRFTIATVLAFAASAVAVGVDAVAGFDKVNVPASGEQIPAGKPYVVKWEAPAPYSAGPIYIQLLGGKDGSTLTVKTEKLASLDNKEQQYTWNVDASLGDELTYGLRFVWAADENIVQYSNPFTIKKADGAGSSTIVLTSSQGVKTVTLSSASSSSSTTTTTTTTTTAATTTTASNTTTAVITSSTASANTTVAHNTTTHASTTLSKTTGLATQSASQTTTAPTTKPTSGAAHAAGSIAIIGGFVAALLAL
ncbi:hypothetical protein CCM_02301 [Cordyceps militaris CM01]|uniref:Yeast cell wall synthesis Kre9/Knh1-like N-terminal domain-containing protein n=1 Tax=Cordyceps militaris (strain CM01) TaxID=983644 RepID=G3J8Z8_CORMM|nr:uncharacterized protein CCM_02301 [Cordyceps militaris CM01]EGX94030.1 hypothetical protein CCM_02301 [Cordyceps militaris CM01]